MFAKDLSNKIFSPPRHQDTKLNYNKQFFFVSWCLGGYFFRFIRVRYFLTGMPLATIVGRGIIIKQCEVIYKQLKGDVKQ